MRKFATLSVAGVIIGMLSAGHATASSLTRTSSFAYDPASGLLTQEVVEPNTTSLRLETDYAYDAFGNKTATWVSGVDITTRGSSSSYSANGQFVSSNTNALQQSESFQYDARFGKPTSHTGPNGLTTTWIYDSFGRKVQETRPDGTLTIWSHQFCSGVNGGTASCPSGGNFSITYPAGVSYLIVETSYASDGTTVNAPPVTVFYDQLDREIVRETQGFDGSVVAVFTVYDALGHVLKTSRPVLYYGSSAPQWTTMAYDTLGRAVTETRPDGGVTTTAYHGLTVTATNALNQSSTVTKNSQGQAVSVTDTLGKTVETAYDAVGNAVQTTDPVGNVVTATYDLRGRKIASSDPDLGNWTYTYNTLSQLVTQTDAKGQVTSMSYDLLGRVVQRVEADMTSSWSYDTAAHGIGKLASSSVTAGLANGFNRALSYDSLGRAVQVATTIDGNTYNMSAAYDGNSRLIKVTYPSGFAADYGYNSLGYANKLSNDATSQLYWTANAMDAEGHLTQQTAGNNLVTTRTFSATTGQLLGVTTGSSAAVQNFSYTYDLLGKPTARWDVNTNLSESFTYDALNRLTSSQVNLSPTPLSKAFTYDTVGNLLSKSGVGNYAYPAPGSAQPHAVTSISGGLISTTFTYDANGNQTAGLGRTISYTSYNKPGTITQGSQSISFLDDTEHQRFKQVTAQGTKLYIAAFGVAAEVNNPGTTAQSWTEYLSVGNALVGMRTLQVASETLSTRYFHTDRLGSISVITDENGLVLERLSYDAWGTRRNPDGSDNTSGSITSETSRGFTGEEELSVAGLVHLNGRLYDPLLSRFTSADTITESPFSTQGWNRYSYVGNNPLTFTDPSGHCFLGCIFKQIANFFSHVGQQVTQFLRTNAIARTILQIGATIFLNAVLPGVGFIAGSLSLQVAAAAGAAIITTGLSGGNLGQILRAGVIAGATFFASSYLGGGMVAQAAIGCASSVASGGSCGSGAAAGAVSAGLSPLTNALFPNAASDLGQKIGGTIIQATAGGLASVAGGGKFENGAITAAFGYLANPPSVASSDSRMNANACAAACPLVIPAAVGLDLAFGGTAITTLILGPKIAATIFDWLQSGPTVYNADTTDRPSGFRQGTVQGAWDNAADGENGGKLCPTCGGEVNVAPGEGPRDWDLDHWPDKWSDRDLSGLDRKGVLDNYNEGVRLRCPPCNRSDN